MAGCAPCAAAAAAAAEALAAPTVDPAGRVWAWCVRDGDTLVCWQATVDIPRSALAYVAEHGLTNPRRTAVIPADATWPEGAPA